jgi:hypothetical protein
MTPRVWWMSESSETRVLTDLAPSATNRAITNTTVECPREKNSPTDTGR